MKPKKHRFITELSVSEQKQKKDEYQKALTVFGQAMKDFHKGEMGKAAVGLKSFIEKFAEERELVDRARIYIAIATKRPKKETVHLKTFEDHFYYAVYKMNSGDLDGALKLLEKALEFKSDEAKVHYLISDVRCRLGQADDCLDSLKKAIQKDKHFAVLAQNEADFAPLWEDKRFKVVTRLA
jgi:tetratricopeptide (TPR) repeat protein